MRHYQHSVLVFLAALALSGCSAPAEPSCETTGSCPGATDAGTDASDSAVAMDAEAPVDSGPTTPGCTPGEVCRASAGLCDVEEICDATGSCPADAVKSSGETCHPEAGLCDAPEVCDGVSALCPDDALLPAGTVCRASEGLCDIEETCTGLDPACPADAREPTTTVCRPAVGDCDAIEYCDGGTACPADGFLSAVDYCPAATIGTWGTCGGFVYDCDSTGTQTRTNTSYACNAGVCEAQTATESQACTRIIGNGLTPCSGGTGSCCAGAGDTSSVCTAVCR